MNGGQDNNMFRIITVDGEALKGDSNKIKLTMGSYTVIMKVQEDYMLEEISEKEQKSEKLKEKIEDPNLDRNERKDASYERLMLNSELKSLYEALEEFTKERRRFNVIASRALRLPDKNFQRLVSDGWVEIEGKDSEKEKITMESMESALTSSQKAIVDKAGDNIFSSVDTEAIKQAVEKTMNQPLDGKTLGEAFVDELSNPSSDFDTEVEDMGTAIKEKVDGVKRNEIRPDDTDKIFTNEYEKGRSEKEIEPSSISFEDVEPTPFPIDISAFTDAKMSGTSEDGPSLSPKNSRETEEGNKDMPPLGPFTFDSKVDVRTESNVLTSGNSINDVLNNDEEIIELTQQISKAQAESAKNKEILEVKNNVLKRLQNEAETTRDEANDKLIRAERILEERRRERISELKDILQKYRNAVNTTTEEIEARNASIDILNKEIDEYKASIARSNEIINSEGGRRL